MCRTMLSWCMVNQEHFYGRFRILLWSNLASFFRLMQKQKSFDLNVTHEILEEELWEPCCEQ